MTAHLVVFSKAPVIGGAKTRLARGVGQVEAWRLYRVMTARVLRQVTGPCWQTCLAVSPDEAAGRHFPGVWPQAMARIAQGHGDLGTRQARVFGAAPDRTGRAKRPGSGSRASYSQVGEQGRGPVIVIGTDAPQIARADIARAFTLLRQNDAVIGPAEDGGYWLLGLNAPAPAALFKGVRWSHRETRRDLEASLIACGLGRIAYLRMLRDVDEVEDLRALGG